jgi:putative copper export protein
MAGRNEIGVVYGAGLVQGVALVTFPAASSILTIPQYYGLTSTAYGSLFLPQAVLAIVASLLGANLTRRYLPDDGDRRSGHGRAVVRRRQRAPSGARLNRPRS